jgi:hypothetical protein
MSQVRPIVPVLLVTAIFSRQEAHLDWARDRLSAAYGPLALMGTPYHFNQTAYYEQTMGTGLLKQLVAFATLVQPDCLPLVKNHTNALEEQLAAGSHAEPRPINIDPGILSLGKFQLATTKDQAHRIYLGAGIFAEVTLRFEAGQWQPWPWTYADYRQDCVRDFLSQARDYYREQLVKSSPSSPLAAL